MSSIVTFPGFGLELSINRVAFNLFGHNIYWYGIIIACGFLLAVAFCYRKAPSLGLDPESLIDALFFGVPAAIVGARLYYILFNLNFFRKEDGSLNFVQMVRIWDGGLAIYGGVIAALLTLLLFCKVRKIKFAPFADLLAFGLLIGQMIGRWGNFVNVEAYGSATTLPWRMGITEWVGGVNTYLEVHPTFLYESLWNLVGLCLLILIAKKWRKFDGQIFFSYLLWYGFGRGLIEGLRTDSLYLFGTSLRVSQLLGFASALVAAGFLVYHLFLKKHTAQELYVNRIPSKAGQTDEMEVTNNDTAGREDISGEDQDGTGV
ncbi:MAG: prolipoprotein diacylglyceryl transferase [Oscillospiraceae bacterium]